MSWDLQIEREFCPKSLDWIILGIEPDSPPETDKDKEISRLRDQVNLLTQTLEALNSLILKKG